jgi:hypothetical protein
MSSVVAALSSRRTFALLGTRSQLRRFAPAAGPCSEPCSRLQSISNVPLNNRERIRQIEAKALRKLRHPSRSLRLKSFQKYGHE